MATRPVIGQEFKMANGKAVIWLDNNSRWWMEQSQAEWNEIFWLAKIQIQILFDVGQLLWCIVTINSDAIYYRFEV